MLRGFGQLIGKDYIVMKETCYSLKSTRYRFAFVAFALIAVTTLVIPVHADDTGERMGVEVGSVTQSDLDGNGTPDITIINCSFATKQDTVTVYDGGRDMKWSPDWDQATDFQNDIWLFDAASDGRVELIIVFSTTPEGALATLWDDQDGDGTVAYEYADPIQVTEPGWPSVRALSLDGYWVQDGRQSFNLEIEVDGPILAQFQAFMSQYYANDGITDVTVRVFDEDHDGQPNWQWNDIWPQGPQSLGFHRTNIMTNPQDDEPPIRYYLFWPLLGSDLRADNRELGSDGTSPTYELYHKWYNESYPPIKVAWEDASITAVGEFVASRFNDNNWFVYSLARASKDEVRKLNFEAPFAFYDMANDNDGYPELLVRYVVEPSRPAPVSFEIDEQNGALQHVRFSWDQDNNRSWDFKLALARLDTTPNNTLALPQMEIGMPDPLTLPAQIIQTEWSSALFVVAEEEQGWESEGLKEWEWQEYQLGEYFRGYSSTPDSADYVDISPGLRGEISYDFGEKPQLYVSGLDHKLHLLHGDYGIWRLDDTSVLRTEDRSNDGYFDTWLHIISPYLEEPGDSSQSNPATNVFTKTLESIYALDGYHLLYQDQEKIEVVRSNYSPAAVQVSPPTDHETWLALHDTLSSYEPQRHNPVDLGSWLNDFPGSRSTINSASMANVRITGDGFRFELTLQPGYRTTGPDLLGLGGIAPGKYLVENRDGAFAVAPLVPAQLNLALRQSAEDGIAAPAQFTIHNTGSADAPDLTLVAEAVAGNGASKELARTPVDALAGDAIQVLVDILSTTEDNAVLHAWLEDGSGQVLAELAPIPLAGAPTESRDAIFTIAQASILLPVVGLFAAFLALAALLAGSRRRGQTA